MTAIDTMILKNSLFRNAINSFVSDADCTVQNQKIILWNEETEQPSQVQLDAKLAELQAEYDAQAYARSRKVEYDALNQLELMSDDSINGTTTHKDAILAIKAKYPKPE
jgi:serine/threonine protein kinase HipA of HipAB toxin-antitoxin module